jgi:hypothetical protein
MRRVLREPASRSLPTSRLPTRIEPRALQRAAQPDRILAVCPVSPQPDATMDDSNLFPISRRDLLIAGASTSRHSNTSFA